MDIGTAIFGLGSAATTGLAAVFGAKFGADATLKAAKEAADTQAAVAFAQFRHELQFDREKRRQDRRGSTYVAATRFAQEVGLLTKQWHAAIASGDTNEIDRLLARDSSGDGVPWLGDDERLTLWAEMHVFASDAARDAFTTYIRVVDAGRAELIAGLTAHGMGDYPEVVRRVAAVEQHLARLETAGDAMAATMRRELAPEG